MSDTEPIQVRDMAIVHQTFRATFAESAELVRGAVGSTPDRATFLADHIDFTLGLLRAHHEGEDALLWPKLLERVPDEAATVQQVADQHHDVEAALDRVAVANGAWRLRPGGEEQEELADSLETLSGVLRSHLDDEERLVVPLAAEALTQAEWDAIGEHSRSSIPQERLFVAFGMILDPLTEEDRSVMLSAVPAPVQDLWHSVGERTWNEYAAQLRPAS
jgi:hypothetical protein